MITTKLIRENIAVKENTQQKKMETYYRFQSKFYDMTRWSFLFGRKDVLKLIPKLDRDAVIMEVGCGTGYNLKKLSNRFPNNKIIGLDISSTMLKKAARKTKHHLSVTLENQAYGTESLNGDKRQVDVILFSYSLSMINPNWSILLEQAKKDLKPGGHVIVVDFEDSRFKWFKKHMENNHVKMDSHIGPCLAKNFQLVEWETRDAYAGLWSYFIYVGKKN